MAWPLMGVGAKEQNLPVVQTIVNPTSPGRVAIPNGTQWNYGIIEGFEDFGVPTGYMIFQNGEWACPPNTGDFGMFKTAGDVFTASFSAFGDGQSVGDGWAWVTPDGAHMGFNCPTVYTAPGPEQFFTYVSSPLATGNLPSHYNSYPPCTTNYEPRYQLLIILTWGPIPYLPPTGNSVMFISEFFDICEAAAPVTQAFAFRTSQTGVRILWSQVGAGITVEKSYDNGVTWEWISFLEQPTFLGPLRPVGEGTYQVYPGQDWQSMYTGGYFDDPYAYAPGTGWPMYRVCNAAPAFGQHYLSNPVILTLDPRYTIPEQSQELTATFMHF